MRTVDGANLAVNVNLPYVHLVRARGKRYAYYRRSGSRIPIQGEIGTFEWRQRYDQIHHNFENFADQPDSRQVLPGSLEALWMAYCAHSAFRRLSERTQKGYERLMAPVIRDWGHGIVAKMKQTWVQDRIDELDPTPRTANALLAVLRLLLTWGEKRGWLESNPARLVDTVKYTKASHRVWRQQEIDAMTAPGSPVALEVLMALYTGQRQGDILQILWSAFDPTAPEIRLTQSKTRTSLVIPVHPVLAAALEVARRSDDTICTRPDGARWRADHFRHVFADTRARLGLPDDLHFHGLRHSAASRLAEAGCSHAEIAAITGHKTIAMVSHYAAGARQEQLAKTAMGRLATPPAPKKRRSVKPSSEGV